MNQLSKDEQIENVLLAAVLWHKVKPKSVDLGSWSYPTGCGTIACFGGWLVSWPEFAAKGVGRFAAFTNPGGSCSFDGKPGSPCLESDGKLLVDWDVANYLFGDPNMFASRGANCDFSMPDYYNLTDYQVVANRLERRFEELTS
jgi:hypothetical protein